MTKTIAILLSAATLLAAAPSAQAHDNVGAGIAAGLLGGVIVGGAIAASRPAPVYGAPPVYGPAPGYDAYGAVPAPVYGECGFRRERFWDGYGWRFRRVRVCY